MRGYLLALFPVLLVLSLAMSAQQISGDYLETRYLHWPVLRQC